MHMILDPPQPPGSFEYPYPVEDTIEAIARHTDLIYIFFDPHGQALCDRTMNVIERLNQAPTSAASRCSAAQAALLE